MHERDTDCPASHRGNVNRVNVDDVIGNFRRMGFHHASQTLRNFFFLSDKERLPGGPILALLLW